MNKEKKGQEVAVIETRTVQLSGDPQERLKQGHEAAKALMSVAQPVMIQGNQYLTIGDWQTIGSFYGLSAGADESEPVEIDNISGFRAKAVVRTSDGTVVSSAVGYCMDEGTWKGREKFAQASMAQTRACSKALRMVVGWVAVLGGYKDTPAEEMDYTDRGITKGHVEKVFGSGNSPKTAEDGDNSLKYDFVCPICGAGVKDQREFGSDRVKHRHFESGKKMPTFTCYNNDDVKNPTCKFVTWEIDEFKANVVGVVDEGKEPVVEETHKRQEDKEPVVEEELPF